MGKTGILGGSFNPIHRGHTAIARAMVESGLVDEVWLMVSPRNPLKDNGGLLPEGLRLQWAQTAVEGMAGVKASDFEFSLPRPSYMYNTLCRLRETHPAGSFSLVIGADNWLCFDRWHRWDDILREFPLLIYPREGYAIDPSLLPPAASFVEMPLYNISSTELRRRIALGQDTGDWIDARLLPSVAANRHLFKL